MRIDYPTLDEPATPEYVLSVLQDAHRQVCRFDEVVDPDAVLTFETTVAEWRDACDLLGWRQLGRAYNEFWGITCSDSEWREALEPARRKRLSDVCGLIAKHALRPRVRPARLLGRTCAPAGTFLTIRSLLHQAGVPVEDITPSTPLEPYPGAISWSSSKRSPGLLPARFPWCVSRLRLTTRPPSGVCWRAYSAW